MPEISEITGGIAEIKIKEAAHTIKEKGGAALSEIEKDIAKISEKLKRAREEK